MPSSEMTPAVLEGLSDHQKIGIEALMDYIATTPQNINYNIVREILKAAILDEDHPYFNYYVEKIKPEKEPGKGKDDDPISVITKP